MKYMGQTLEEVVRKQSGPRVRLADLIDQLHTLEAKGHGNLPVEFVGMGQHYSLSGYVDENAGTVYLYGRLQCIAQNVEVVD